jgi:hypothetical protein
MSRTAQIRELLEEADYYEGLAIAEHNLGGYPSIVRDNMERSGRLLEEALVLACNSKPEPTV